MDILCTWIRTTPSAIVTGKNDQSAFEAAFSSLMGRAIVAVERTEDAYDPLFTLDDGSTFMIIAKKNGDL